MSMKSTSNDLSRRDAFFRSATSFLTVGGAAVAATTATPAVAATPQIVTLDSGIKYATTKAATSSAVPQQGDIVAVDYTG